MKVDMEITEEHIEILTHAKRNNRMFCGDSKEMQDLCKLQMMEYIGQKSFVPDPYFKITKDGMTYIEDLNKLEKL